jgi:hypothetical protein
LFETSRAYAVEKLAKSGEFDRLTHRHEEYYRDRFERVETELETHPAEERFADGERQIGDLGAAGWPSAALSGWQSRCRRKLRPARDPHAAYASPAASRHARNAASRTAR